jgi:hypothetical protein
MYVPGLGDMGTTWRLRRSTDCTKTALPRVRMECALVTEMIETGRVAAVRLVLLATACARATGAAVPAARMCSMEVVLLVAACAGCTVAVASDDMGPGNHGPGLGGAGAGAAIGSCIVTLPCTAFVPEQPGQSTRYLHAQDKLQGVEW